MSPVFRRASHSQKDRFGAVSADKKFDNFFFVGNIWQFYFDHYEEKREGKDYLLVG